MAKSNQKDEQPRRDFRAVSASDAKDQEFPGRVEGEYRVYFEEEAYRRMKAHAGTTDQIELCGVLVGDVGRDGQGAFLRISGVIEGEGANNYGTQVTFTHNTWSHIHSVKDREYPDKKIVGWYHTHPGFGVFLSEMDSFIQDNFFGESYQVAVVLETQKNVEGCFAWVNGRNEALSRYWVGKGVVDLSAGRADPFSNSPRTDGEGGERESVRVDPPVVDRPLSSSLMPLALAFLVGILLGQLVAGRSVQNVLGTVESDVYSILETAALSSLAQNDLREARKKVDELAATSFAEPAATVSNQLVQLSDSLAARARAYEIHRATYRSRMLELATIKKSLQDRVGGLEQTQLSLNRAMAEMCMVQGSLLLAGPKHDGQIPPNRVEMELTKDLFKRAIELEPACREALERQLPGVLAKLFLEPERESKPKDGAKQPPDEGKAGP